MVTILGTLGDSPETLLPTIRSSEDVNKVVAFRAMDGGSERCSNRIRDLCRSLEIDYQERVVDDPYQMLSIARTMQMAVHDLVASGEEISSFNIAGGTKLMSGAAMFVCAIESINAVYVHDETNEEIHLPLVQINFSDYLTEVEKKIIRFLLGAEGNISQKDICEGLELHKATVNHHIRMLMEKGVVHLEPREGDRRIKDVKLEAGIELLLEVLA